MNNSEYVDFYGVDALLTAAEKKVRNSVREFVDRECMPGIAEYFDLGAFPMELIPRMAQLDLFGTHVDGYGCKKQSHMVPPFALHPA